MIGLLPILARWRLGLSIAGALALLGLIGALSHYRHAYHAEKALRASDRAAYVNAQEEATLIAKRALDATEARYRSKANEADQTFKLQMADVRGATDRYIATHRVRVETAQGDASGSTSSAQGDGAGLPETMPAGSFVAISQSDLQACTVDAVTANGAFHWALSLAK